MPLTKEEIEQIAVKTADQVIMQLDHIQEERAARDLLIGIIIGEGAIPVHGRELRKEPCHGCRIDPTKPLEAGNVMVTTSDAIGTLSAREVRGWCSEIVEMPDGRCERARTIREAARECKGKYPSDTKGYFECFIPKFKRATV